MKTGHSTSVPGTSKKIIRKNRPAPLISRQEMRKLVRGVGMNHVYIEPIFGLNAEDLKTRTTPQRYREAVLAKIACGITVQGLLEFGASMGIKGLTDVWACLNGGYSSAAKNWGTPFVRLVILS